MSLLFVFMVFARLVFGPTLILLPLVGAVRDAQGLNELDREMPGPAAKCFMYTIQTEVNVKRSKAVAPLAQYVAKQKSSKPCANDDGKVFIVQDFDNEREGLQKTIVAYADGILDGKLAKLNGKYSPHFWSNDLIFNYRKQEVSASEMEHAYVNKMGQYLRTKVEDYLAVINTSYHTRYNRLEFLRKKLEFFVARETDATFKQSHSRTPLDVSDASFGLSYEKRTLPSIRFGPKGAKQLLWIECGIHAREWISHGACMYLADEFLSQEELREMLTSHDVAIQLSPAVNPDGYEYTWKGWTARFWRKNRRPLSSGEHPGCKGNCTGIDLNRNFDQHFENGTHPDADDYAGQMAFSEPETASIRDEIFRLAEEGYNVLGSMSFHGYGQFIFWSWAWAKAKKESPSDKVFLEDLGKAIKKGIKKSSGREYKAGTPPDLLYPASGATQDWLWEFTGCHAAYSMELPPTQMSGWDMFKDMLAPGVEVYGSILSGFQPPPEQSIKAAGEDALTAIKILVETLSAAAKDGKCQQKKPADRGK